ncbi:MAG: tRNA preQ1(34) S-adenosylmethionine ribosyltransferase-isomerase QueA [Pirellulaceae bacterium]|nr:tRNA preQ1(34) S-adenosylmethionine ribosyltransferase-isomerase QueA [Pirellulaceae bacterium]
MDDIQAYDYHLPRELIAQYPTEHRIDARLMLLERQSGQISHYYVRDLPELVQPGDALVLNNSQVIPARLVGIRTATGGRWEGLFLREDQPGVWELLSKTRGHLNAGESISLQDREGRLAPALTVLSSLGHGHLAVRPIESDVGLAQFLERYGRVPLPPYIRDGQMVDSDQQRYQTVYADQPGSVAAPTAGLHFTADLIRHLQHQGVQTVPVTLHVGLGTFRPVAAARLSQHVMHSEWGELSSESVAKLQQCRSSGGRIIAVGTTSARVLESAAQVHGRAFQAWSGQTNLLIRPPYQFRALDALMTNFHLPSSTLLALVCAFAGHELTMEAYHTAIQQRYRFYSYGDCMLIV